MTVTGQTFGRLWMRYRKVREKLGTSGSEARPELERQAGQLRNRLVVNYSPLVKYVASRVRARITSGADQEDMISWVF